MKAIKTLLALLLSVSGANATITRVQSKTANSGAVAVTSQTVVLDAAPTAGNTVVLVVSTANQAYITQTAGISWTTVANVTSASTLCTVGIGRVYASASATITVTCASSAVAIVAAEYSGTNLRMDKTASATGASTSLASGATGTTTTASQLWLGAMAQRNTNGATYSAPTNSFSIVAQTSTTINTSNNDRTAGLLDQIVTATGTPNAGVTSSVNNTWVAVVATLEEVPVTNLKMPSVGN